MNPKKDGTPRKPRKPFFIVDTNAFELLLKEERARLGSRAANRLVEGSLLFKATLIGDGANVSNPVGKPVWAYSPAQAVAWAGRKRGTYLSLGRFVAVEASLWHGQCYARIVTCLSRFDSSRPLPTGSAVARPQLTLADAREFMAREAALPDPPPDAPSFRLRPPPIPAARRKRTTALVRPAPRADDSSLFLFAPDTF